MEKEKQLTMAGEFKRESNFWFAKGKNEEGEKQLGDAKEKFADFTLLANNSKKQTVSLDLSPYEGQRSVHHAVEFNKSGVTMNIQVTVLPDEEYKNSEGDIRSGNEGCCCTNF